MKHTAWFYIFCFVASTTIAATEPPWPREIRQIAMSDYKPVLVANMPEGISLYNHPNETLAQREKRILHIASFKIKSSSDDVLIVKADEGGSAGAYQDIYRKQKGGYVCIGQLGAGFGIKLLTSYGGYPQIEYWSRGGGGNFTRELFRFEHGKYKSIRGEDFRGYEGTYLRTQKTNE